MKANKVLKKRKNQRHDQFFKHHFSHREQVADFLKGRLSPDLLKLIDLSTLEKKEDTFLANRVRGTREADVIWEVKTKKGGGVFFFFHFEGQSSPDQLMAVRTLEYHTGIIRKVLEAGYAQCPPIFTFVIYHGKKEWKGAKCIADLFSHFDLYLKYGLKREFLIEPAKQSIEELKKDGLAFCAELVLAKQPTGDMKTIVGEVVHTLECASAKGCCTEETYTYLFDYNQGGEEEILNEIVKFAPEEAIKYRDMFERATRRHEQIGLKKGRQEGRKESDSLWEKRIKEAQAIGLDLKTLDFLLKGKKEVD